MVFHLVYYPWSPRVICIKILSCQLLCSFDSRPQKKKPTGCSGWDTSQTKIRYSCNVLKAGTCVLQSNYPSKTWFEAWELPSIIVTDEGWEPNDSKEANERQFDPTPLNKNTYTNRWNSESGVSTKPPSRCQTLEQPHLMKSQCHLWKLVMRKMGNESSRCKCYILLLGSMWHTFLD